ncbi:metalloprotease 1 precursor [Metarhizium brunneum]
MLMANAVNASAIHVRQEAASPCQEQVPSEEIVEISRKLRLEASNSSLTRRQQGIFNIRVYAHVVFHYGMAAGGYVPEHLIANQIQIMNRHYRNVGISFTLADVDEEWNPAWAHGYDELVAGFCYLPIPRRLDWWELVLDGCVVIAREVPMVEGWTGRDMAATHPVGHYLGLYHTFESGNRGERRCFPGDDIDDDIDDAYPQEIPSYDNPQPIVRACGGRQRSNMYNFMDYSDYSNSFTPQQASRMRFFANVRRQIAAGYW